jgi:hypothetical protein
MRCGEHELQTTRPHFLRFKISFYISDPRSGATYRQWCFLTKMLN